MFVSQSAAETKWPKLLPALGKNVDKKMYSDEEIKTMTSENKCRLIKEDSAIMVRYFDNRYLQFFNLVVKSPHAPVHEVSDYFTRYEFAEKGTIHIHWFAYLENAPEYGETDNDTVARFYDNIISCSLDVLEVHKY